MRRDLRRVDVGMGGANLNGLGFGLLSNIVTSSKAVHETWSLSSIEILLKFNLGLCVRTYWIGVLPC